MSSEAGTVISLVIGLGVLAAIFLSCRAVVLWYWKVDKIVDLLEEISEQLEEVLDDQRPKP
jgi:hypothetical protein